MAKKLGAMNIRAALLCAQRIITQAHIKDDRALGLWQIEQQASRPPRDQR
ncbi:MAG: hypothetical protein R3D30_10025 [Hyphomicrobiales bacterium]